MPPGLMVSEVIRHFLARRHNPAMPRILLIDDDEHLAAPLTTYFARFGCTLDSAVRPSEGLAACAPLPTTRPSST
jgi:two-component system OmpR family response regulator